MQYGTNSLMFQMNVLPPSSRSTSNPTFIQDQRRLLWHWQLNFYSGGGYISNEKMWPLGQLDHTSCPVTILQHRAIKVNSYGENNWHWYWLGPKVTLQRLGNIRQQTAFLIIINSGSKGTQYCWTSYTVLYKHKILTYISTAVPFEVTLPFTSF
jgi:hypothetical protein